MTEAQVWYKVAEKLADPTYKFDNGLCWELSLLFFREDGMTRDLYEKMKKHCQSFIVPEEAWRHYWAYPDGEEREARILAALFFAEMSYD